MLCIAEMSTVGLWILGFKTKLDSKTTDASLRAICRNPQPCLTEPMLPFYHFLSPKLHVLFVFRKAQVIITTAGCERVIVLLSSCWGHS